MFLTKMRCFRVLVGIFCTSLLGVGIYFFLGGFYYVTSERIPCLIDNTTDCAFTNGHAIGVITVQMNQHLYNIDAKHTFCATECCRNDDQLVCMVRDNSLQIVIAAKVQSYFVILLCLGIFFIVEFNMFICLPK